MSKKVYISAIALAIVAIGGFNYANNPESKYSPKESVFFDQAAGRYDIALAYNMLIKGDENGEIKLKDVYKARQTSKHYSRNSKESLGLIWSSLGPTNVGGRTRAVCPDKFNKNVIMAGAVGGGIFVSDSRGETWWPKHTGDNNLIADIVQGADGAFYAGTGPALDDWFAGLNGTNYRSDNTVGTGIFRTKGIYQDWEHILVVDDGDNQVYNRITHMSAHPTDPNVLFVGTFTGGLRVSRNAASAAPTFQQVNGIAAARIVDVDVSPDGNTVIAISGSSNGNGQVWRSTDGGQNFVQNTVVQGSARIECVFAPSDPNIVYLSAVEGGGCLHSIQQSNDGGETWNIIASGGSQGNQSTFDPFANPGVNCQGNYDNAIGVFPNEPGHILVGGVQLWEGIQQPNSDPPIFGWTMIATTNGSPSSPIGAYVHADKHNISIPEDNVIYIGSDGGIGKSTDGGNLWSQNNLNYSTAQFYSLAIAPQSVPGFEIVMGGTQDNGTLLAGYPGLGGSSNSQYAFEVQGGDGFDCDIATVNVLSFATSQNGALVRYDGENFNSSTIWDEELETACENGCGEFYTAIEYWETTTADPTFSTVVFYPNDTVNVGDTMIYPSATAGYPLKIASPQALLPGDSIELPDRVQHQLAFANVVDDGARTIFITRDAGRITGETTDWYQVVGANSYPDSPGSELIYEMLFSNDGNHLFFGTQQGNLYRLSNLSYAINDATGDIREPSCVLTCTRIASGMGGNINGIALDPNNNDHMIVTVSGYGKTQSIFRITNALTALQGGANPQAINGNFEDIPVFDPEIDVSNGDFVLIGTEYGVYTSDNAFSENNPNNVEWNEENSGLGRFPVYEIKQQTTSQVFNFSTGQFQPALNYKTYYLATHGAGIFKTESLVGIGDIKEGDPKDKTSSLLVYPNPVQINSKLEFYLHNNSNAVVKIFNLKGQVVNEINLGNLPQGKQIIDLQTGKLSAGTYLVSLQAGDINEVVKIIKSE